MKHHCAHPPKAGKSVREGAAQKRSKSQQHPEPSSKKADGGQKRGQEKEVTQPAKKREKRQREQSPEETGSRGTKKVKLAPGKTAAWQPLPASSIDHLGGMMDSVILSILSKSIQEKDDIQKHLNLLKERLLRRYRTLKVPVGKLSNLKNVPSLKVAEKENLSFNEEAAALLQEEITTAVQTAENTDENIQSLQDKIQSLRNRLEEAEDKAKKVFQKNGTGVLSLPELPKHSLTAPTLQEEILKIQDQKGILKDLSTIQHSAEMKNMLTLLEQAYEKVDSL
ncbi:centromere protein Q isoform X1 [Caretta caretta]|uniref:centromere protein Q isoform X1 n=1 Tax=Caretta caretta TaxID=8467 RepID=UPI002095CE74|nr:centromere protein Q isoform X1 [Caretta caretta]XP_048701698.1 centromere protein Q isoform X1 [Caretta caretta]XP_048701699.1 centromere protein Q isoform X1 [Caretta caretta]